MGSLVLQPSELAHWHALVNEAQEASTVALSEDLESYLVFLLMRFAENPDVGSSIIATDFLENINGSGEQRRKVIRDVGDKCLLISGLFPGRAKRRMVRVSYFVDMGQSAYSVLASSNEHEIATLFEDLCHSFVNLMDVLQATRDLAGANYDLQPLEAQELWDETKSKQAYKALQKYTDGFPIYTEIPDDLKKK